VIAERVKTGNAMIYGDISSSTSDSGTKGGRNKDIRILELAISIRLPPVTAPAPERIRAESERTK
jgi:hypothetical protein